MSCIKRKKKKKNELNSEKRQAGGKKYNFPYDSLVQCVLRLMSVSLCIHTTEKNSYLFLILPASTRALTSAWRGAAQRSAFHLPSGESGAAKWLDVICGICRASACSV